MSRRIERVNELLREELSQLVLLELRDPRASGLISITGVATSPDLRHATVYFSTLGGDVERAGALAALRQAAGFLRRRLGGRVDLRVIPELDFRIDPSVQAGARIDELLAEIGALPPARPSRTQRTPANEA
ncbi:MAG: ribosome-binding factor A [Dehalococcoidia bacterium]|jgi:ribosome-binding factor A|nr:MAG: ribosome-binding factor A [Dehalococcoidia bacterium]